MQENSALAPAYPSSEGQYSQPAYGYPYVTPFSAYGSTSALPSPPLYGCSNSEAGYASIGKPVKELTTWLGAVAAALDTLATAVNVLFSDSSSESESSYYESESCSSESESS